jgi:hypothetical protein
VGVVKFLFYLLAALGAASFIVTVTLAYIGALTDDVHAWQAWFVSLVLTLVLGAAAVLTAEV